MDDFERELKIGFLEEAAQAVADVEQAFLVLETNPNDTPTLDKIFRLAHNLKGSAKAVGFDDMGAFTHEFETFLIALKSGTLPVNMPTVNLLLRCNDHISEMIEMLKGDLEARIDSSSLIAELKVAQEGGLSVTDAHQPEVSSADVMSTSDEVASVEASDSVVPTEIVEETLMASELPPASAFAEEAEEPKTLEQKSFEEKLVEQQAKPIEEKPKPELKVVQQTEAPAAKAPPPVDPHKARKPIGSAAMDDSIRVSIARVEKLLNFVGEMVILQAVLREQVSDSQSLLLKKTVHQLGKVTKEIQDMSMALRMVPVKPTFQKMQRIVRDTAQQLNKTVHLHLVGEDTELDKTVLERINDPLVHLVRNSVDHGVETGDVRVAAGKKSDGNVTLSAYHQSGKLVLEVKDDGGGLDPEKLKAIAIKKGVLKEGVQLSDREAYNLIFAPGFSTKAQVTDISGRGVGMDVVKTNIAELGGEITIETELGKGTTFKIFLPLTLAIIDGMVVKYGTERYVIPLSHVHESIRVDMNDIKHTTGLGDIFMLRGENLPLFKLGNLLNRKTDMRLEDSIIIVVRTGEQPFAILVDDIIGQYQVVIKQLGAEVQNLRGISGSTILGDGRPALILEPGDLVRKDMQSRGLDKRKMA